MSNNRLTALLVFILTITFYTVTLLPSLAWGDGAKLQSEVISGESFVLAEMTRDRFSSDPFLFAKVGVAAWDHPLYIMLGHVLVRTLRFVDALWLVNFISAVFGAASVALVFLLCYRFTDSTLASCFAALSLAVSHTFWWHSSTPEVYTLFVFLFLVSFYLFDHYERRGKYLSLVFSGLFLGLAASNHILAFLALPALALYYLSSTNIRVFQRVEARVLVYPSLGFIIGFLIYLIQFARMTRSFPPAEIMGTVVGMTFLSRLEITNLILLGKSAITFLFLLMVQFNPVGLILGAYGIRQIFRSENLFLRKIAALLAVFTSFGVLYQVSDQFAFFMTAYVFWAIMMGIGAAYFSSVLSGKMRSVSFTMLAITVLATPFFYNSLPSLAERYRVNDTSLGVPQIGTGIRNGLAYYLNPNKRGDFNAHEFGRQTISNVAPGSVVIAEWYTDTDEYFILRYFAKVEKLRSDVTVVGWPTYDPFTFDPRLALNLIERSFPDRPIYLASLSDRFYASSKLIQMYCIVPENNLYRLYQKEASDLRCLKNDSVTE
ncbi:MAG TPA: DUF2723 domain-containing protein [Anaerolineales bacterium]